jgi:hypothetical protein
MRHLTLIAVLFVAGRSDAQPAPPESSEPAACEVRIVRAPDDVRREIENWIAREPPCRIALDVRVIPTEGGLYLMARDSTGRLHERLVPDAQAAGVLVASWVADDTLEPTPPPPGAAKVSQSPGAETAPAPVMPRVLVVPAPAETRRWAVGLTVLPAEVGGTRVRGTVDIVRQGGAAAELILGGGYSDYDTGFMQVRRIDTRGLLGLSWTQGRGTWRVRFQAAAGAVWSHVMRTGETPARNWAAIPFEGSVALDYHMSAEWSVSIAPIATAHVRLSSADSAETDAALSSTELGVLLELRRGL